MPTNGRIAGVFNIGTFEEPEFAVAEWFPDPEQIEAELISMANAFDDWTEPLFAARAAMIQDTRIHFESQSDPYGDKWEDLDPDYYHSKVELGGFPDQILSRTGALEKAATGEEAWFITENSIFFNVEALPKNAEDGQNYGAAHQAGTREGPRRAKREKALLAITQRSGAFSAEEVKQLEELGTGRGLNLPQRMFIGADLDTIEEIEGIFIDHLNNTVTRHWGGEPINIPRTPMGENVMGQFPIISFSSRGQPILRTPKGPRFGRFIR
jgi:hypothetical protein